MHMHNFHQRLARDERATSKVLHTKRIALYKKKEREKKHTQSVKTAPSVYKEMSEKDKNDRLALVRS
jgi:hypothetical protein